MVNPNTYQSASLLDTLRQSAPGKEALMQGARVFTAGEVLLGAEKLAAGMLQLGMKKGDTAVIAAMPDAGFIRIVYAAIMAGIRLAVIDPEMGRDNYREKLRQLGAGWAFVDYRLLLLQEHPLLRWLYFKWSKKGIYFPANSGARIIATGSRLPIFQRHVSLGSLSLGNVEPKLPEQADKAAEFLITYTSGTTSTPKGVVHSLGAISESIGRVAEAIAGGHNRRMATHLPYFALIALNTGATAYLWKYNLSAAERLEFIETNQITTLFSPPCDYLSMIEYCEQRGLKMPDCLEHLFFGSAPVHRAFLERIIAVLPEHVRLSCLYGMTENLLVASIDGREKAALPTQQGDILGRPVPGVELKFAADGEILLRSPQTYSRYLHEEGRPEWHASGDLGFLDDAGRLVLTGRKKDMIIRRNFNLYPGLYEPTINRIPGVTECAFVGVYDESLHDERVALFVETHASLSEGDLRRWMTFGEYSIDREALPDIIYLETLPRSGRQFKVDKKALRETLKIRLK